MRKLLSALILILFFAGCTSHTQHDESQRVYLTPGEAFVHEFTRDRGEYYDIAASIELLDRNNRVHMIDLNGDGVDECFVYSMHMVAADGSREIIVGASGNGTYYLLRRARLGWVVLNEFGGNDNNIRDEVTMGWPDIETMMNGGAQDYNTVYRWNGSCYEIIERIIYEVESE